MLHTVNKSPFERNSLESCLRHAAVGTAVLLIEDGVYGAMQGTSFTAHLQQALKSSIEVYALRPDVEARGIQHKMLEGVSLIDYGGFVDLVVKHSPVMAWL